VTSVASGNQSTHPGGQFGDDSTEAAEAVPFLIVGRMTKSNYDGWGWPIRSTDSSLVPTMCRQLSYMIMPPSTVVAPHTSQGASRPSEHRIAVEGHYFLRGT